MKKMTNTIKKAVAREELREAWLEAMRKVEAEAEVRVARASAEAVARKAREKARAARAACGTQKTGEKND